MLKEALIEIFERDLRKLTDEINLYKSEESIWKVDGQVSNSAGTLCLHLIGNLNHFIGALIGKSGYVRDRDSEFSLRNISRKDLLQKIENTIPVVKNTLLKLSDEDLQKDFPQEMYGKIIKTDFLLIHLLTHLSYHLGQVNYHRRLVAI